MAAGALAGCASESPRLATSAPEVGDSVEQVVQRGYRVVPVYVFAIDGHEYSYVSTSPEWSIQALILIDGRVACTYAIERSASGLLEWEWVGEPDGVAYLASRLCQACGLDPETPSRTLPSLAAAAAEASTSASGVPQVAKLSGSPPIDQGSIDRSSPLALLGQILEIPLGIVTAPYWIAGATAAGIVASPFVIAEHSANQHQLTQRQQMRVGLTLEETVALLGKPEVEFPLAAVGTTVLMFEAGKGTKYYVGFENDRVIWIHDAYPWLNQLAKQAKEAERQQL